MKKTTISYKEMEKCRKLNEYIEAGSKEERKWASTCLKKEEKDGNQQDKGKK